MKVEYFADHHFEIRPEAFRMTDEEFYHFATQSNARIERDAQGTIYVMPPVDSEYSSLNFDFNTSLGNWNRRAQLGKAFDSSGGFTLPDSAVRSPDAAWIAQERWDALTPEQRRGFARICPDFVMELRSPSDSLHQLQEKMEQFMRNGARLGWLLDPISRQAWVYRKGCERECIVGFSQTLSGEEVLPGFSLELSQLQIR